MESIYNYSLNEIVAFALVLLRVSGLIVTMPIIGNATVPASVKVLLSLSLTLVLFPQVGWKKLTIDADTFGLFSLAIKEIFVGLVMGTLARLFFHAISMAGQIMSVSLGLSAGQLMNPAIGEMSTAIDQFLVILASIFFLTINGHHVIIGGVFQSYNLVPLQELSVTVTGFGHLGEIVQSTMAIALKVSAPILVSILFLNVAVAIIGKAVPQINILITSLPINILSGLMVLIVCLPLLIWEMRSILEVTTNELFRLLKSM